MVMDIGVTAFQDPHALAGFDTETRAAVVAYWRVKHGPKPEEKTRHKDDTERVLRAKGFSPAAIKALTNG